MSIFPPKCWTCVSNKSRIHRTLSSDKIKARLLSSFQKRKRIHEENAFGKLSWEIRLKDTQRDLRLRKLGGFLENIEWRRMAWCFKPHHRQGIQGGKLFDILV